MRILAIGEAMVEFTRQESAWGQSCGGDTLNTAVHLARLGADVGYASALGTDDFSLDLRRFMEAEGIDTSQVAADPRRQCGIYFISTAPDGERSFTYWRSDSAARHLVDSLGQGLVQAMQQAGLIYLSLISVAILSEADRESLLEAAVTAVRGGARLAFDSNYRPALWEDTETAARWSARFSAVAHIGLPTLEDEVALGTASRPDEVAEAWASRGCEEVVVKLGAQGCLLHGADGLVAQQPVAAIDTSGAGDSFNAAYLWSRMNNRSPQQSAAKANRLAAWVVGQPGAIPRYDGHLYETIRGENS